MTKNALLACTIVIATTSLIGCHRSDDDSGLPAANENKRPQNLVLVTIDTLRADRLGCYGSEIARTPTLDSLAAEGVRFDLATTVTNNTLPSHAAILTGKYPQQIGVPRNGFPLPEGIETLATRLKAEGYATAAIVSASSLHSSLGLDRGFDLYDEAFNRTELDQEQRPASATTKVALTWLHAQQANNPFFLWVHYFDPHYPYSPPSAWDTHFAPEYDGIANGSIEFLSSIGGVRGFQKIQIMPADLAKVISLYDGEIAFLDEQLSPLIDALNQPSHRRNTSIIVVADHGESLTEHNYFFDHGEFVYQPSMRVPLIIRPSSANSMPQVNVIAEAVQTTDIFATALNFLGLKTPTSGPSRDLSSLWANADGWPGGLSFGEGCRPWAVEELYPANIWPNAAKWQFVLDPPWKLAVAPYKKAGGLFNLKTDPGESDDLSAKHPEVVSRLWRELQLWRETSDAEFGVADEENLRRLRTLGYVE